MDGSEIAARHRGIHEAQPALCAVRLQLLRNVGRGGGVVDQRGARRHAGQGAIGPQGDAAQVVVIAHTDEHHLRPARGFTRRGGGVPTIGRRPGLSAAGGAVVDRGGVPGTRQVACHGVPHHAQTDEGHRGAAWRAARGG